VEDLGERSIVDLCVGDLDLWLMSRMILVCPIICEVYPGMNHITQVQLVSTADKSS
jgi:hypothetical protein